LEKVIQIEKGQVRKHLGKQVLGKIEETLHKLLDAEVDQFCNAVRNE
jgi:putative transposase